jgi:hypothetical protein
MAAVYFVYILQKTTITEIALFLSKSCIFILFQEPKLGGISVLDTSQVHISAILLLLIVENIKQLHFVSFQGYNI